MAELVDAPDSKSSSSNGVWVRFPLRPPDVVYFMIFSRIREDLFLLIEVLRTRFFKIKIKIVIVFDIFIFFRNNTHDWNIVV